MPKRINISIPGELGEAIAFAKPLLSRTISAICAEAIKKEIAAIEVPEGLTRMQLRKNKLKTIATGSWLKGVKIDLTEIEW